MSFSMSQTILLTEVNGKLCNWFVMVLKRFVWDNLSTEFYEVSYSFCFKQNERQFKIKMKVKKMSDLLMLIGD